MPDIDSTDLLHLTALASRDESCCSAVDLDAHVGLTLQPASLVMLATQCGAATTADGNGMQHAVPSNAALAVRVCDNVSH